MQILSLTVKNFKIYHDRHFEFQPGVNAICGENGAGKTSILEAIAWVLFNYTGDCNAEELRRQGESHTEVTVSFISNQDGRTYQVQRKMGKGRSGTYTIFDPQLQVKIDGIHRVEDAVLWLQEHLGIPHSQKLSPSKYLAKLFGEVIGIPQGSFANDFLKTKEKRKEIFDPILQVEDYKVAYQKAFDLEKFAESKVREMDFQIQSYGDRLQDWESLKQQFSSLERECQREQEQLSQLQEDLKLKAETWEHLRQQEEALQKLANQLEQSHLQIQHQQTLYQQSLEQGQRAQAAVAICDQTRSAYHQYLTVQQELQQLQQQRQQRDQLLQRQTALEKKRQDQQVQHTQLTTQLAQLTDFRQQLQALSTPLQEQATLTVQAQELLAKIQHYKTLEGQQKAGLKQQQKLQYQCSLVEQEIQRLIQLQPLAEQGEALNTHRQRLQHQLAHRQAAIQFYQELHQLWQTGQAGQTQYQTSVVQVRALLRSLEEAVPLWSPQLQQIETTLESGLTLQAQQLQAVTQILQDLSTQVDEGYLQQQLQQLEEQWKQVQEAQQQRAKLPTLQQQRQQYQTELLEVQQQLATTQGELQQLPSLQSQQQQIETALKALGDPQGQARILQQQLQREPQLLQQLQTLQSATIALERELSPLGTELAVYANLEQTFQSKTQALQILSPDYQQYLQQEQLASTLPDHQARAHELQTQLTHLQHTYATQYEEYSQQQQRYSAEALRTAEEAYQTTRSQQAFLEGNLQGKQQNLHHLSQRLAQYEQWQATLTTLEQERQQKQDIYQFVKDARTIFNQSGPRITGYYLEEIRQEADRLFRELMNRPGMALDWTEDYEIRVQENQAWRNFRTLSGGEQTAAALAVRLALLKVLADLDVAFFDEPTVNLDQDRRSHLAEALANLKSFRQLFVISHDDTFETLTENIIRLERSP
jgi:exonuclease SbcC